MAVEDLVAHVEPTAEEQALPETWFDVKGPDTAGEGAEDEVSASEGSTETADEVDAPEVEATPDPVAREKAGILASLKEERVRRQNAEKQLEEYQALRKRLDEVAQKMQAPTKPEPEPDTGPDPESDPVGYLRWENQRVRAEMEALKKAGEERFQQLDKSRQEAAEWQQVVAAESRFSAANPDFKEAVQFMRSSTLPGLNFEAELAVERGQATPQQAQEWVYKRLQDAERAACLQALRNGLDPADYIYRLAQAHGYRKAEPAPAPAKAPAPPPAAPGKSKEELQRASRSLGPGGAPPPATDYGDDVLSAFLAGNRF